MDKFSNIKIGEMFYVREDGQYWKYIKISDTEAVCVEHNGNSFITDFENDYSVNRA